MADIHNEKRVDKKARLRKEAEERNAAHASLTPQQKLDKLNNSAYRAQKEREQLQSKIEE
jgi:hypothetical protein